MEKKIPVKCYKTILHFPENIPLVLHISKQSDMNKHNRSVIYYKERVFKTISNDDLEGYSEEQDGKKYAIYVQEDADGKKTLKSKVFSYTFDSLFDEGTFVDIKKENNAITIYYEKIPIGSMSLLEDDMSLIFRKRDTYKGRIFSDEDVQIIRCAYIHQHTDNSFLDGAVSVKAYANKIEYGGAITDHGNMHGVYEFYKTMKKLGKKPIIGCEVYLERLQEDTAKNNELMDSEYRKTHFLGDHMILLAKDNEGLKNLNRIVSYAHSHFYRKPHVTYADLKKYSKGLIATSACIANTLSRAIDRKQNAEYYASLVVGANEDSIIKFDNDYKSQEEDDNKNYSFKDFCTKFRIKPEWCSKTVKEIEQLIYQTSEEDIVRYLKAMISLFGKEDFYIEIQRHQFEKEERIMNEVLAIAKKYDLKIVFGIDSHYLNKEEAEIQEMWMCLQTGKDMDDPSRIQFGGTGYHVHTIDESVELFKDIPEALENSLEILDKCNVEMGRNGQYYLPKFPLKEEDLISEDDLENQKKYFIKKVREGYKKRFYGTNFYKDKEYLDRIQFEINTIVNMGFPSYFTIVQDFILYAEDTDVFSHWRDYFPKETTERYLKLADSNEEWVKKEIEDLDSVKSPEEMQKLANAINDDEFSDFVKAITKTLKIQVGPGRGSAAGSLVAYCLEIVKVDPIPYGLLFERFLNPDRISMPDIDVDIEDRNREDVINYVRLKYGRDCVARIATQGTAAAKAIIKDVCRVSLPFTEELISEKLAVRDKNGNVSYPNPKEAEKREKTLRAQFGNKITKMIPDKPGITIKAALEESIDFKEAYDINPKVKFLVDTAILLEGLKKNLSVHACGVLVTKGPIVNYMPMCLVKNKELSTALGHEVKQWTTQYSAPECEDLGCLKIDLLGLRTLSTTSDTLRIINKRIREGFYVDDTIPETENEFLKNDYSKAIEELETELKVKLDNKKANKKDVEEITTYLQSIKEDKNIKHLISLQTLQGAIMTPSTYINQNVTNLTKMSQQRYMLHFENIPINDKNVYRFIATGRTDGIFQIESPYMKSLMKNLYQDVSVNKKFNGEVGFERLCDANALGRPGPMKEIPNYIRNMLHPEEIEYEDERMREHLSSTNGIITYQEQMMKLCRELAGFTGGQADTVRKGCAKKIEHILDEYGYYFIYGSAEKGIPGCVNNGISEDVAKNIWDKMLDFGKYAFNKSHSVTYSVNSAVTAWLSYYFPIEYMTSVINSYLGKADKIKGYLAVCKQRGIPVLEPNVNLSLDSFTADKEGVRFGLHGLLKVGVSAKKILEERKKNGEFTDILDFVKRMTLCGGFRKDIYRALCYSGCFDSFEGTRQDKLNAEESILRYSKDLSAASSMGQKTMMEVLNIGSEFADVNLECTNIEMPRQKKLSKEYHYAGFYITEHPLNQYAHLLKNNNLTTIGFLLQNEDDESNDFDEIVPDGYDYNGELIDGNEENIIRDGTRLTVAGIIKEIEILHRNSDGAKFAKFKIEDQSGAINAIIFTKNYKNYEKQIVEDKIAVFGCRYQKDDYGAQLQIESVNDIANIDSSRNIRSVYLLGSKENKKRAEEQFREVKKLAKAHPGNIRVFFRYEKNHPVGEISIDSDILYQLYEIMDGEINVTINHYG